MREVLNSRILLLLKIRIDMKINELERGLMELHPELTASSVKTLFKSIAYLQKTALESDGNVPLPGVGKLYVKFVKERSGRCFGKDWVSPAHNSVKLRLNSKGKKIALLDA